MTKEQDIYIDNFFKKYNNRLKKYVIVIVKDNELAEDITQETWYEALRHIDKLMRHPSPELWLKRTAKNKIRNNKRIGDRYLRRFISLDTVDINNIASMTEIENDIIKNLTKVPSIQECMQRVLTEQEIYLLSRIVLDKASHSEVSKELGISVSASQKRLERIRKKMLFLLRDKN